MAAGMVEAETETALRDVLEVGEAKMQRNKLIRQDPGLVSLNSTLPGARKDLAACF
jgi:hypothetical protein